MNSWLNTLTAAAVNYPIRLLSRQVNPFTAEILAYIDGAPEKIIILIDLDEHMACNAGNSFYEKQVDNVFIVTGGDASMTLTLMMLAVFSLMPTH